MTEKIILVSGAAAVGKTALLKHLLQAFSSDIEACVCKIDCLKTNDRNVYESLNVPVVVGLSEDICPDHFLASNLPSLIDWSDDLKKNTLIIETAGLCNRCCPATEKIISVCVVDCTVSIRSPEKLGPMLTTADIIAFTKIDMISQAEREILSSMVQPLNPKARQVFIDGICGYGIEFLAQILESYPSNTSFEGDILRTSMPAGVCSYCIGEQRIGKDYQQGIMKQIEELSL